MYFRNKTEAFYYKMSLLAFYLGFPNFWIEDLQVSKSFKRVYRIVSRILNIIVPLFIIFEFGGFITQKNLTKKQESDLLVYTMAHPMIWSYTIILSRHKQDVKMLFSQVLKLKSVYNDKTVENLMLKKAKRDSTALLLSCGMAMVLHTASALMQYIKSDGTFTTVVTMWPLVDDTSRAAHAARIIINVVWWIYVSRVMASYILVIGFTTGMSHQYMNLQSYFYSLQDVFDDTHLKQQEKERKYEKSFKLGVKLHSDTIEVSGPDYVQDVSKGDFVCRLCEDVLSSCKMILDGVTVLEMIVKSERTIVNAAATAFSASTVLISTGFFLWNAGDITIEASKLSSAMYFSGWQHCQDKGSYGIRRLVVIAITHAQKPVLIKGLGMMNLSYDSYLTLVKSSYSVFSVIY